MSTTMKEALDEIKLKRFENVAETIIKYQNYKTDIAISKMDNSLGKSTRINYLMYGIRYLKTGYKSCIVPSSIYKALDKCIEKHIQPLRPSESEKKRVHKRDYTKKNNNPPVSRLKMVQKPVTEKFTYGVKVNDNIVLQKSEIEAKAFLKGIRFLNNNNDNNNEIKLVAVTISEVE